MSRLPAPDGGWRESTEGDLDPDLTEEAESSLDDWSDPFAPRRGVRVALRVIAAIVLAGIVVSTGAVVLFR